MDGDLIDQIRESYETLVFISDNVPARIGPIGVLPPSQSDGSITLRHDLENKQQTERCIGA